MENENHLGCSIKFYNDLFVLGNNGKITKGNINDYIVDVNLKGRSVWVELIMEIDGKIIETTEFDSALHLINPDVMCRVCRGKAVEEDRLRRLKYYFKELDIISVNSTPFSSYYISEIRAAETLGIPTKRYLEPKYTENGILDLTYLISPVKQQVQSFNIKIGSVASYIAYTLRVSKEVVCHHKGTYYGLDGKSLGTDLEKALFYKQLHSV